jgi:hypothetical protein
MGKVKPRDTPVLVRETSTTTYHFGLVAPICEARPTEREAEPVVMNLDDALQEPRRLCRACAELVEEWIGAALSEASATELVHPDR